MPAFDSSDQCDDDLKARIDRCLNAFPPFHSIAFPALGTGGLKYPADVTARYMFEHVEEYLLNTPHVLKRISFVVFPADVKAAQGTLIKLAFLLSKFFLYILVLMFPAFDSEFHQMRVKYSSKNKTKPVVSQSSSVAAPLAKIDQGSSIYSFDR